MSIFAPFYITVLVVCMVALITLFDFKMFPSLYRQKTFWYSFLFFLFSFTISSVNQNHRGVWYSVLIFAILLTGIYLQKTMQHSFFKEILDIACICSIACAGIAILQKYIYWDITPDYRPVSTFVNANYYATMIEFIVLIAVYRLLTCPQNRILYFITIIFNLIGLYFAASISSFLSLSCALILFLFLWGKTKLSGFLFGGSVLFILAAIFIPQVFPRLSMAETSYGQRLEIWETAIRGLTDHWLFGQGPMSYPLIASQYLGYMTSHCHNLYLDVLLNFGIVGTAFLVYFFLKWVKIFVINLFRRVSTREELLVLSMTVAVLIHGVTDVTIFWIQTAMLFLLVISSVKVKERLVVRGKSYSWRLPNEAHIWQ